VLNQPPAYFRKWCRKLELRESEHMASWEELIDHMDQPGIDQDPAKDIRNLQPDITRDKALALQLQVKRRRAEAGDRIIGHQASFTSSGIRTMFPDAPFPMIGTLSSSLVRADGEEVTLDADKNFIESELAMILKRDLEGPDLSPTEILAAVEGFFPAIEVAPLRDGVMEGAFSFEHMIAVQKAKGGYVVFGSRITAPHALDTRLEGCIISIDGQARAGATGHEAMGGPLNVVAAMARGLHRIGEKLRAGQIIMTGSLAPPQIVTSENRTALLEFHTLGNVSVRIAAT